MRSHLSSELWALQCNYHLKLPNFCFSFSDLMLQIKKETFLFNLRWKGMLVLMLVWFSFLALQILKVQVFLQNTFFLLFNGEILVSWLTWMRFVSFSCRTICKYVATSIGLSISYRYMDHFSLLLHI